jgi:hypothetical protein
MRLLMVVVIGLLLSTMLSSCVSTMVVQSKVQHYLQRSLFYNYNPSAEIMLNDY